MAEYIRFEVYLPTYYTITERDPQSGTEQNVRHMVDPRTIREFINDTLQKYQGITQSNPALVAPFKGWWQSKEHAAISVDHISYIFGLVKMPDFDDAIEHFTFWKGELEKKLSQEVILITYFGVQTIGDFF